MGPTANRRGEKSLQRFARPRCASTKTGHRTHIRGGMGPAWVPRRGGTRLATSLTAMEGLSFRTLSRIALEKSTAQPGGEPQPWPVTGRGMRQGQHPRRRGFEIESTHPATNTRLTRHISFIDSNKGRFSA